MTKNDDLKYQLEEIITLFEQQKIERGDIYYELDNIFISSKELVNTLNNIVDIIKLDIKRYPDLNDESDQVLEISIKLASELMCLGKLNIKKISEVIDEEKYDKIKKYSYPEDWIKVKNIRLNEENTSFTNKKYGELLIKDYKSLNNFDKQKKKENSLSSEVNKLFNKNFRGDKNGRK